MYLGEAIIETNPLPIYKSILKNGIGISGLNIQLSIQRDSDSYYWQNTDWGVSGYYLYMTEVNQVDNPGFYTWDVTTSGFLGESTRTGFHAKFYASGVINFTQEYYSLEDYPGGTGTLDGSEDIQRVIRLEKRIIRDMKK